MHLSSLRVRGLRASADGELEIILPGRFTVLVGANASGKTTVSDAMYLVHAKRFPQLPRFAAAALGEGERLVEVEYSFDADSSVEGPLGRHLQAQTGRNVPGTVATMWSKTLRRSLGRVATQNLTHTDLEESMYLVHLPAWRNPFDELARRETRILVELLRAQQQNLGRGRDLTGLRSRASAARVVGDGRLAGGALASPMLRRTGTAREGLRWAERCHSPTEQLQSDLAEGREGSRCSRSPLPRSSSYGEHACRSDRR